MYLARRENGIARVSINKIQNFAEMLSIALNLYLLRKKANIDLGETGEFNQRRIYDDQNTFDLLRVASEVLGEFTFCTCISLLLRSQLGFQYYLSSDLWLSISEEAKYR